LPAPVPQEQAENYAQHTSALVEAVNTALFARTDLMDLLHDCPRETIAANHRNHAAFMATVLRLGNFVLLRKILPWVYRAYHNQGVAYAYFRVELETWIDAISRILPPPVDGILAVYQWMLDRHETTIAESQRPSPTPGPEDPKWKPTYTDFTRAIMAGDVVACLSYVRQWVHDADSMLEFFTQVLQPALYTVGAHWENGTITVAQEHLASAIVARILASIPAASFAPPELRRGTAVVSAAANEFHEIGAWMVAMALESDSWNVHYLGANTPRQDLEEFVRRTQPDLLCLSVAMPFNLEAAQRTIADLRRDPETACIRILVGGQALLHDPEIAHTLGADAFAPSCSAARDVALELLRSKREP